MGSSASKENEPAALEFIESTITEHPVTIFSKSYCPYCTMAKDVMKQAGVGYHVVELDMRNAKNDDPRRRHPGRAGHQDWYCRIYSIILVGVALTLAAFYYYDVGRTTVPNVFINKVSVGGGTDVRALFQSGKLTQMLQEAGVLEA